MAEEIGIESRNIPWMSAGLASGIPIVATGWVRLATMSRAEMAGRSETRPGRSWTDVLVVTEEYFALQWEKELWVDIELFEAQ